MERVSETVGRWRVGQVTITRVVEREGPTELIMLPDAGNDALAGMTWLQPHFADATGQARSSIHSLVVDTPTRTILVDTCLGNDKERVFPQWHQLQTRFLDDLAASGYPPERIDAVLCTHMHTDHVGWNTRLVDGSWVPTFPGAEYLFGATEWEFVDAQRHDRMYEESIIDSIDPVIEAGLATFVPTDHRICDEVVLEATPGHTPGHVSVRIESEGATAIITGDIVHHPCQLEQPRWECLFDWHRETAERTRIHKLGEWADDRALVFGTHFATPSAGYVRRHDGVFRFDADEIHDMAGDADEHDGRRQ